MRHLLRRIRLWVEGWTICDFEWETVTAGELGEDGRPAAVVHHHRCRKWKLLSGHRGRLPVWHVCYECLAGRFQLYPDPNPNHRKETR